MEMGNNGKDGKERSVLFIDGSNFYHSMKEYGVRYRGELDYSKISLKLIGKDRHWQETRYYVGQIANDPDSISKYVAQKKFISRLKSTHSKIKVCLGRIEKRKVENPTAQKLKEYLSNLKIKIDKNVFHDLQNIAMKSKTTAYIEKAVDVKLAIDLVTMAEQDKFDAAYLLSDDGDFTPAVEAAKAHNKKVFSVSLSPGAKLAAVVNSPIPLSPSWFSDCYL